jgi:hypothetical protein
MESGEKNPMLFSALVIMLHSAAMQQLGKIKHPATGKIERHLPAAQDTIDILDMLKEKTKGNLSPDEDRLLTQLLAELKLNYVDEAGKPDPQSQPGATAEGGRQ